MKGDRRNIGLDLVRIVACWLVVCYHAPHGGGPAWFLGINSLLVIPCIGLFFMVSGSLLLPVNLPANQFLKKRFSKIIAPTLIWNVIYLILNYFFPDDPDVNIWEAILSLPFSGQGPGKILWFMYTLSGLYLIAPILSPWLQNAKKQELRYMLGIWAITQCYPLVQNILYLNSGSENVFFYFSGYLGYFILGFYIKKFPEDFKLKWSVLGMLFSMGLSIILKKYVTDFSFGVYYQYLSILNTLLCLGYFQIIMTLGKKLRPSNATKFISAISSLTFGVYLMHMALLVFVFWKIDAIMHGIVNYPLRSIVLDVLSFSVSMMLCYLISKTSIAPFLIGIKQQRKLV